MKLLGHEVRKYVHHQPVRDMSIEQVVKVVVQVLDVVEEAIDNLHNCSARVLGFKRRCENS